MIRFMLVAAGLIAYVLALAKIGYWLWKKYDLDPLIPFYFGVVAPAVGLVGWLILGSIW